MVGGVVTSICAFRQGLIKAGHEVHVIAPEASTSAHEDFVDEEPYVFRLPAFDVPGDSDLALAVPFKAPLTVAVRGLKPDLIHSQTPILMGDLAAKFARDLNIPLVLTVHSRYHEYIQQYLPIAADLAGKLVEEIVGRYLERCSHVIAPTIGVRDLLIHKYKADVPITVVPTPVDLSQYDNLSPQSIREALGLSDEAEVLLYIGRLAKEKGLTFLLRTFDRIASERDQPRLLLVGEGSEREALQEMAEALGIGERVIFTGMVPHCEIPHYAAAADLFVFSSFTETQGLVLVEAMAAGTPVVAVEAPGPMDVLAHGGGLLVPREEEAFADAVLTLLASPERLQGLGEQARRATRPYAVDAAIERLLSVYDVAIRGSAK
jgi:glycosyltransferase involved in cell wall biosynthesis